MSKLRNDVINAAQTNRILSTFVCVSKLLTKFSIMTLDGRMLYFSCAATTRQPLEKVEIRVLSMTGVLHCYCFWKEGKEYGSQNGICNKGWRCKRNHSQFNFNYPSPLENETVMINRQYHNFTAVILRISRAKTEADITTLFNGILLFWVIRYKEKFRISDNEIKFMRRNAERQDSQN